MRPGAFRQYLDLHRPIFQKTAAYGHFGREDDDFTWERTDRADALRDAAGLESRRRLSSRRAREVRARRGRVAAVSDLWPTMAGTKRRTREAHGPGRLARQAAWGGDARAAAGARVHADRRSSIGCEPGVCTPSCRGVYAVGRPRISPARARWMAAVLACGRGRGAEPPERRGALGDRQGDGRRIDSQRAARRAITRPPGIEAIADPSPAQPRTSPTHDGIPLTTPVRTLLDLATELRAEAPRARGQRGGQARPDRPRGAAEGPRRPRRASPASGRFARSSTSTPSASPTTNWNSSSARSPPRPVCRPR